MERPAGGGGEVGVWGEGGFWYAALFYLRSRQFAFFLLSRGLLAGLVRLVFGPGR